MSAHAENAPSDDRPAAGRGRRTRFVSAAAGAALLAYGARRRSVRGVVAAAAGGWLLYRGVGGARPTRATTGTDEPETATAAVERSHTVTVAESAEELYERWRDPETQAVVFGEFAEVTAPGENRQRWTVDGPFGRQMTWDVRIVEERPAELLRWKSVEDATVSAGGAVRFRPAPGDRGTEMTLQVSFDPPGGAVGEAVAERLGFVPERVAASALRRFKSLVEAGEIPTLEKNPSGRGRGDFV